MPTMDPSEYDWTRVVFDHVHLRVADLAAGRAFYATVLEPLGVPLLLDTPHLVAFANLALSADRAAQHRRARRVRRADTRRGRRLPRRARRRIPRQRRAQSRATTVPTPPTCSTPTAPTSRPRTACRRRRGCGRRASRGRARRRRRRRGRRSARRRRAPPRRRSTSSTAISPVRSLGDRRAQPLADLERALEIRARAAETRTPRRRRGRRGRTRAALAHRVRDVLSTASPARWPCSSLTRLKWSRSATSRPSDACSPWPGELLELLETVEHRRAVEQARERVEHRLAPVLAVGRLGGAGEDRRGDDERDREDQRGRAGRARACGSSANVDSSRSLSRNATPSSTPRNSKRAPSVTAGERHPHDGRRRRRRPSGRR